MVTALGEHTPGFQRLVSLVVVKAWWDAIELPEAQKGCQGRDEEQRQRQEPTPRHRA